MHASRAGANGQDVRRRGPVSDHALTQVHQIFKDQTRTSHLPSARTGSRHS